MNDMATAYARIIKTEKQSDGTLMVYGKATDDSLDIDQQICDANWLDRAMPDWFKSGGNIREQHSNIAAGVAKEYEAKSDGHYINTLIVDPVSVKKVETGVLKGFSIGIKSPRVIRDNKAANGRIIDGQIIEVSLVDRPANPNAKLMLAKSVKGKKKLVKVEEFMTKSAVELIQEAKTLAPEIKKFDAAAYEAARRALAQLIVVEANEMANEGHNEEMSIGHLLSAVSHLFAWYEGEEAEGEVREEIMEQSAKAADEQQEGEVVVDGDKAGEIEHNPDNKECKCMECMSGKSDMAESGSEGDSDTELKSDIAIDLDPMRAENVGEKSINTELETEEVSKISETEKVEEKALLPDSVITDILEKAVKSAKESVKAEIDAIKSAKEAVENELVSVKSDLAKAQSLAVGGGPKRTAIKSASVMANDNARLANEYFAKAASSTDKELAKGYRELAQEFLAKSQIVAE